MKTLKVSVVVTVYNEEGSVSALLDSLLAQTRKPDEIVVVDGGSTDSTPQILKKYEESYSIIRIVNQKSTISEGRNISVREAKYPIIAQIDGGCTADRHWLSRITKPFHDHEVGLVAGFYEMVSKSPFQDAAAPFLGIHPRRFDPRVFLPSGRSVAFRKSVWEMVGGYTESLERAGEDTIFNYKVIMAGVKIERVRDALVYWEVPPTFKEALIKFYYYAKGDAQSGIWWHPAQKLCTHNIKIMGIFTRYALGLGLLFLSPLFPFLMYLLILGFVFYVFWSVWKMNDVLESLGARLWVPVIQISSDLVIMFAFLTTLTSRGTKRAKAYN